MPIDLSKEISAGQFTSNVYPSEGSLHLSKLQDDVIANNRFVQTFSSLQFGSQGISLLIPNDGLCEDLFICMVFPAPAQTSPAVLGLVPVAAYTAISQIEWQVGGSTVYQNSGIQHMYAVLDDCDSVEKRQEVIRLAGGSGSANFTTATAMYAAIKVPWSSISGQNKRKNPLDSRLVNQPLRVNIYLRPANALYYNAGTGTLTYPTTLVDGFFQQNQLQFDDASHHLKLKQDIVVDGQVVQENKILAYPFTFLQSFTTAQFAGTGGSSGAAIEIPLSGFRSGNLLAIRLMMFNLNPSGNTALSPLAYPATSSTNYLATEDPLGISLYFNGLQLFRSKYDSWKMSNVESSQIPNIVSATPTSQPYYWVVIPFSQFLPESIGSAYQKGINLSSQTIVLQLYTQTTSTYQIFGDYLYHADIVMDGSVAEVSF